MCTKFSFFIVSLIFLSFPRFLHAQSTITTHTTRLSLPVSGSATVVVENKEGVEKKSIVVSDYLSSTKVVLDEKGTVVQTPEYYPYGNSVTSAEVRGTSNTNQINTNQQLETRNSSHDTTNTTDRLYTGQRKVVDDSPVYNYNARYYNPDIGLFIQPDTVEGINRFAYVGGNPVMRNDPSGHKPNQGLGPIEGGDVDGYKCKSNDLTCKKTVTSTWLKLNGAIGYSKARGYVLTPLFMSHFLYGNGETLDITSYYEDALLNNNEKYQKLRNEKEFSQNVEMALIAGHVSSQLYDPTFSKVSLSRKDLMSYNKSRDPTKFVGSFVLYADFANADLHDSLHQYTVNISGDLSSVRQGVDEKTWTSTWDLTLDNPNISIYDRYDWDKENLGNHEVNVRDLVLGRNYYDKSASEMMAALNPDSFLDYSIKLADRDVATLMDPKVNMATPFDIAGSINVGNSFSFTLQDEQLRK